MKSLNHIAGVALLLAGASAVAQIPPGLRPTGENKPSAATPLPPTTPTFTPLAPVQAQGQPRSTATISTVRRATVTAQNGLVTVAANNSSLNQILREIARQTGIKITGGVTDERVFGTYGPSDLSTILTILLDGTGSNMMLSGDAPGNPQTLTLTPRQGGISPPSPQQTAANDDPEPAPAQQDLPPQLTPRQSNVQSQTPQGPVNPPQPNAFIPPIAQPETSATPAPGNSGATTTEQSPNGVKTPQQIYDQLMKLQSQQPKPPQ